MSIESIASLKGLGGGFHSMSRGSSVDRSQPPAQQQDGGLLQDTARELEQLFDEFQATTPHKTDGLSAYHVSVRSLSATLFPPMGIFPRRLVLCRPLVRATPSLRAQRGVLNLWAESAVATLCVVSPDHPQSV